MFRPYVTIFRTRGAALLAVAGLLGALPIGMLNLGVVLMVQATTGSFAGAGTVGGAFGVGNAVGLIIQGRLISRWGQTWLLVAAALLCPASLVAFAVAAGEDASLPLLVALAAVCGASIPAVTSSMRVLWPVLVTEAALRPTAYAVMATEFQVAMVTGPLLVSGLLLVRGPAAALLVAAGAACGAGLLLAATPTSRRWRSAPEPPPVGERSGAGMRTLLVGAVGGGAANGMLIVGVPAAAATQHRPGLAGLLFAACSAGELLGGIAYGARPSRVPPVNRLLVAQAGMAGGAACLVPLAGNPGWMLPVMFVVGAFTAPVSITGSALLDDVAPPSSLARSYTVMVAAGLLGGAGGNVAGGLLARGGGHATVFAATAGVLASAFGWTRSRRRTLRNATLHRTTGGFPMHRRTGLCDLTARGPLRDSCYSGRNSPLTAGPINQPKQETEMSELSALATEPEGVVASLLERFNSGKVSAMMALYEPEAVFIAKDGRTVTDRAEIAALLERDIKYGLPLEAKARHVFVSGDIAQIVLDWSIDGTGPDGEHVHLEGSASDVVRRGADGFWRYVIDNNLGTAVRQPA